METKLKLVRSKETILNNKKLMLTEFKNNMEDINGLDILTYNHTNNTVKNIKTGEKVKLKNKYNIEDIYKDNLEIINFCHNNKYVLFVHFLINGFQGPKADKILLNPTENNNIVIQFFYLHQTIDDKLSLRRGTSYKETGYPYIGGIITKDKDVYLFKDEDLENNPILDESCSYVISEFYSNKNLISINDLFYGNAPEGLYGEDLNDMIKKSTYPVFGEYVAVSGTKFLNINKQTFNSFISHAELTIKDSKNQRKLDVLNSLVNKDISLENFKLMHKEELNKEIPKAAFIEKLSDKIIVIRYLALDDPLKRDLLRVFMFDKEALSLLLDKDLMLNGKRFKNTGELLVFNSLSLNNVGFLISKRRSDGFWADMKLGRNIDAWKTDRFYVGKNIDDQWVDGVVELIVKKLNLFS